MRNKNLYKKTRIGNMIYRHVTNQWGLTKLYYMDFNEMKKYYPRVERIYVNNDGILCNSKDMYFDEYIQQEYQTWLEEEVERILLKEHNE